MQQNESQPQRVASLMRVNIIALISLVVTVGGSCISAVWVISGWLTTLTDHITYVERQENENGTRLVKLEGNIVSLDKRANEINAELLRLHNVSDSYDAVLRARLDVIEERMRYLSGVPRPEPGRGR